MALVLASSQAAQAASYEFRAPKKGLAVSSSAPAPSPSPAPAPAPAPAPTYLAQLSASTVGFDAVQVGESDTQQLLLSNVGTGALTLSAPLVTGAGFSASTACGATLAAGEACLIDVTFSPTQPGAASGSLSVGSNATGAPLVATLTGTGAAAAGTLSANVSENFGTVYIGDTASRVFTFTNSGAGPLSGVAASLAGAGYSFTTNTCGTAGTPVSLAAGASCSMTVAVTASIEGTLTGALTVASSAANAPHSLSLTTSAAYSTPDAYLNSVALLFNAETGTNAAPANARGSLSLTAVGSPQLVTTDKRYGLRSGYLNGTSTVKSSATASGFGTGDFTIEGWFKYTGTYSSSTYLGFVGTDTTSGITFYIGSNAIRYAPQNASSVAIAGIGALQSNTWQHLAIQRQAGTMRVFVNGTSVGSVSAANNFPAQNFVIGGDGSSAGRFTGYVDDVRVTPGVARYPSTGFTPGPAPSM